MIGGKRDEIPLKVLNQYPETLATEERDFGRLGTIRKVLL